MAEFHCTTFAVPSPGGWRDRCHVRTEAEKPSPQYPLHTGQADQLEKSTTSPDARGEDETRCSSDFFLHYSHQCHWYCFCSFLRGSGGRLFCVVNVFKNPCCWGRPLRILPCDSGIPFNQDTTQKMFGMLLTGLPQPFAYVSPGHLLCKWWTVFFFGNKNSPNSSLARAGWNNGESSSWLIRW